MENYKTLRVVDLFSGIYKSFGVDYRIMRKILQVKLTMDQRRVPTILNSNNKPENDDMFTKSLFMYILIGFFISIFLLLPFPLFFKMNIYFGMVIFMIMTVMISDYSSVLLDIVEKNILLPKPIDIRTYNAAKVTHIYIYLLKIIFAISLPGLLIGSFKHGLIFAILYPPQMLLMAAFVIFSTSILYYIILHFFDGERLKDIINYFQIFLAAVSFMIYQLIGKAFEIFDLNINFTPTWWSYFLPSSWFAAPYSIILEGNREGYFLVVGAFGIIIPIILLSIYYGKVAKFFEEKLQKLNASTTKKKKVVASRRKRQNIIANIICRGREEKIFYKFTHDMLTNERALKLKLYPSIAMAALMPLVFLMRSISFTKGLRESLAAINGGNTFLYIYFSAAILATSSAMISTTEKYQAAWIYNMLPINKPVEIYKGALKAFIMKLIIPIYLVITVIFTAIYGLRILPDILLILLNTILMMIIILIMGNKAMPFSQNFDAIKHNSMGVFMGTSLLCGIMTLVHWFFVSRGIPLWIYILVSISSILFAWMVGMNKLRIKREEETIAIEE
ncbi:ABC transporter permease [Alkaliphilus serpentinus]|uniref:ABC transporter permease n=1 Tax=Alkaliphilus serpentinus TaxID=1482731 RepID=A0A833HPS9_9FIRM|nr:ABC transporter permease [Alkaliphilus serpentinus]KAB3531127.1 ABC transporter permease [Alkaliphilus serpentinus]